VESSTLTKIAEAVGALHADKFFGVLADILLSNVSASHCSIWHYIDDRAPQRLYDHAPSDERHYLHTELLRAAYVIGPYYSGLVKTRAETGFYLISDIAPEGFAESEYYRTYYKPKGVSDEGMFFIRLSDAQSIGVLIEKVGADNHFTVAETARMGCLSEITASLICHHVGGNGEGVIEADESTPQSVVTAAFESFGSSLLSEREREICTLILKGHSSKSGARILNISPETERVYRKRLYGKLGVVSQGELFWLFIRATEAFDPEVHSDPLVSIKT